MARGEGMGRAGRSVPPPHQAGPRATQFRPTASAIRAIMSAEEGSDVHRLLTAILAALWPVIALAQDWTGSEFDARLLSDEEKRLVQAALVVSGDYVGLLDGAWGRASQRALERYTIRQFNNPKPRFADLAPLLEALEAERVSGGWETVYFESTDTSYAHPFRLLDRTSDRDTIRFDAPDGRLALIVSFADLSDTLALHRLVYRDAVPSPEPYQSFRTDRLITSIGTGGGTYAYIRSDLIEGNYVTVSVIGGEENRHRIALIAASMQRGRAPELVLPAGGLLSAIVAGEPSAGAGPSSAGGAAAPRVAAPRASNPFARPASRPEPVPAGSGTGFFINNTDLVTAAHVIDGCRGLKLAGGADLTVTALDRDLDLAVVTSSERAGAWLELSTVTAPKLGEQVTALGYPYLAQLGTGLTATGGNVSSLGGLNGDSREIMISAPVQPGNSGGPLLNRDGAVIGVVVSRVDDMKMLESTGTLPQNMNFAVPNDILTAFLTRSRISFPASGVRRIDPAEGIPAEVAEAVVPIFCYQ